MEEILILTCLQNKVLDFMCITYSIAHSCNFPFACIVCYLLGGLVSRCWLLGQQNSKFQVFFSACWQVQMWLMEERGGISRATVESGSGWVTCCVYRVHSYVTFLYGKGLAQSNFYLLSCWILWQIMRLRGWNCYPNKKWHWAILEVLL